MCFEWRSSEAGEKQQGRERIAPRRYIENDAILVINIRTISPGVCFLHWFAPGPHIYLRQTNPCASTYLHSSAALIRARLGGTPALETTNALGFD